MPETYGMLAAKLWAALHYVLANEEFDYVLRTNTSSYIHRARLAQFVRHLPRTGFYGGPRGFVGGLPYASGTGILMSRDIVEQAVSDAWDFSKVDDVCLGEVLARGGVQLRHIHRPVLTEPSGVMATSTSMDAFMWRCRGAGEQRNDIETMHELHRVLHPGGEAAHS